jgi:serine/threonine protein phosphatase 1
MRRFVMGDIHGDYIALVQCLERSGSDYYNDQLIQLGDISDGLKDVYECVDELLKIKNLVSIKGNHDEWFREFIESGYHPEHLYKKVGESHKKLDKGLS